MESSSFSFPCIQIITLLIFSHTMFSSVKPVAVIHFSEDLYTRSRNASVSPPPPPVPVPALYVIGDSSVDCGTNNFLGTLARADHLPYGRDFDTHRPTGRFSNGRVPVDFLDEVLDEMSTCLLALRLGLPFAPSYLGQSGSVQDMMHGLNYASAGAGIIFSSGSELGQHISFSQQIQQVMDTFQQFILTMGEHAAADHISNSVFYISIGTNDFIHYYLPDVSGVQSKFFAWMFTRFLAQTMKQEIKNLYNANVRRVVVMGLAPIGCAPYYLWQYNSQNGECIKPINNVILEFNFVMRYTVEELNKELVDANIIFCDAYAGSMDILKNKDQYGFTYTDTACCGLGRYNGWLMCLSSGMACRNATNHLWWDQFHPTSAVNEILAENVWSGLHNKMCYPMNMQQMVAQRVKTSDDVINRFSNQA
ncbi:putative triacylglycerol lipase [Helianthus annuus]|nr:putative triacylglycerol lipase [Helianthus annuus]KAJ0664888.1 putative triacylglycerol lipase [Helianthus annuus]KAJ0859598.1 putative triacylglycerol lipase [Helianthus annuus]